MEQRDINLNRRDKEKRKDMRAATRALELHLDINGGPKMPGHAQLLGKMNSERAKHGLPALQKPPGRK